MPSPDWSRIMGLELLISLVGKMRREEGKRCCKMVALTKHRQEPAVDKFGVLAEKRLQC